MKGFTIIELLVVLGISAMLTAIAIVYTGVARNETALKVEAAKVAGFIFRAKDLSLATYGTLTPAGTPKICGYGVLFNLAASAGRPANTYSLFAYEPNPSTYNDIPQTNGVLQFCPDVASTTMNGIASTEEAIVSNETSTWNVPLEGGIRMATTSAAGDVLLTVLFSPPNPNVRMSNGGPPPLVTSTLRVYLETGDGSASTTVTVTGSGEVDF